jgi:hypothetical protein
LVRIGKRLGGPFWRAAKWRIEKVVDERVGARLAALESSTDPLLNQVASTSAVLRESGRASAALAQTVAEHDARLARLEREEAEPRPAAERPHVPEERALPLRRARTDLG